jgi:ABC-2 type transport system ATP-binding protein
MARQEVWQRLARLAAQGVGVIISTHDLAEAEQCSHIAYLSEGRAIAVGTPAQVAHSAPAVAFLLSGVEARRLAPCIDVVPGVIASYPQGSHLRIVAEAAADERLRRVARANDANLVRVAMQLWDAALVFSRPSSRNSV